MTAAHFEAMAIEASTIVDQAKPLLAGHPPQVQGLALAELTAIWLSGHPLEAREDLIAMQVTAIHELTELFDDSSAAGSSGAG